MNKQQLDEDAETIYALISATDKIKWTLIGFMAGVLACFLLAVLA